MNSAGSLGLGITTISDITSRLRVRGTGATSATTALLVENTNASASMVVLDNGFVGIGTSTDSGAGNKLEVNGSVSVGNTLFIGNEGKILGSYSGGLQLIAAQSNTAQNVRISQGQPTAVASASALLQVDSTTKGFLPPRMTNAQRTAIPSSSVGLMVYCTDATEGLYIYKSTGWTFIM